MTEEELDDILNHPNLYKFVKKVDITKEKVLLQRLREKLISLRRADDKRDYRVAISLLTDLIVRLYNL